MPVDEDLAAGTWAVRLWPNLDDDLVVVAGEVFAAVLHERARFDQVLGVGPVRVWEPPHELAFDAALCDDLVAGVEGWEPGTYSSRVGAVPAVPARMPIEYRMNVGWSLLEGRLPADRSTLCQVLEYVVGDHIGWHRDRTTLRPELESVCVSLVAQLSDPDEYTGGSMSVARWSRCRTRGARWRCSRRRRCIG